MNLVLLKHLYGLEIISGSKQERALNLLEKNISLTRQAILQ